MTSPHNSLPPKPIHLWAPGLAEGTGGIQAFARHVIRAVCELHPERQVRVFVKNDDATQLDPLRAVGAAIHSVSRLPGVARAPALAALASVAILKERPACVLGLHLNFLPAIRPPCRLMKIPYAGFLYGIDAWEPASQARHRALKGADWTFVISQHTRREAHKRHGFDLAKTSLLPCTFDTEAFSPGPKPPHLLQKYGLEPEQPVLLTVGRLARSEQYKGHREVLAALPRVLSQFPKTRYVVAGSGDDLHDLRQTAAELGVADAVIFAGFVPNGELPDYYRLCDAFVMPSTMEGFGIVYLEAMASGKSVIAGNLDGSVDALDQGRLGVLVNPTDCGAIAEAVVSILGRSNSNRLLFDSTALSACVKETFGFEAFKRRLAQPLHALVSSDPPEQN